MQIAVNSFESFLFKTGVIVDENLCDEENKKKNEKAKFRLHLFNKFSILFNDFLI